MTDDFRDEVTPVDFYIETNGTNGSDSEPLLEAAVVSESIARLSRADRKRADEIDTHTDDIAAIRSDVAEMKETLAELLSMGRHNRTVTKRIGTHMLVLYPVRIGSGIVGGFLAFWSFEAVVSAFKLIWQAINKH